MKYNELASNWYDDPLELDKFRDIFIKRVFLNKWWVSESFPFEVHQFEDIDQSGASGYLLRALQTLNNSTSSSMLPGTMKMLQIMDKTYSSKYDDTPLYEDQTLYNHKETAIMFSNLRMVDYLKNRRDDNSPEIQKQIVNLTKKIKKYQNEYPERII